MDTAGRQLGNGVGCQPLAVALPFLDEALHGFEPELAAEVLDALLAHAGGGQHGQVVAVPDLGDADALLAHADDVADILIASLDANAGEDEGALLVDVDRLGGVGGGDGVAAVGLVRLHAGGEDVCAFEENGHQDGVVGGVGVSEVGVVVEEGVALLEVGVQVGHRFAEEAGSVDVAGDALGRGEELVVGVGDGGGEVAGDEGGGAGGAYEGVGHLAGDAVDAVGHDEHLYRIHGGVSGGMRLSPSSDPCSGLTRPWGQGSARSGVDAEAVLALGAAVGAPPFQGSRPVS